jgi:hypothetical protein
MTTAALVLAAVLAIVAVLFVARPFLRSPGREERYAAADGADLERLALIEERDRALAALKELEFDHRTGKVSDADYAEALPALRQEAAAALAALDPPQPSAAPPVHGRPVEEPQRRG